MITWKRMTPQPEELRLALLKGKATVPGDEGVTYDVARFILNLKSY